jgi:hypothetical protein
VVYLAIIGESNRNGFLGKFPRLGISERLLAAASSSSIIRGGLYSIPTGNITVEIVDILLRLFG